MDGAGDGFFHRASQHEASPGLPRRTGGAQRQRVPGAAEGRIDNEPTMEAVAICALLHDLCKANTYVREHHAGPGEVYSYVKKDSFPMGHGEKSVYLIARFMKLEDEEALAIRWHMGAWDDAVRGGSHGLNEAMKLHRIVYELHAADMRATHIVEAGMA